MQREIRWELCAGYAQILFRPMRARASLLSSLLASYIGIQRTMQPMFVQ